MQQVSEILVSETCCIGALFAHLLICEFALAQTRFNIDCWNSAVDVKTAQKPVSGSNLFPVPASSEAGFSAPAPKLPHTGKQTEKRISASALPLCPSIAILVNAWTWVCVPQTHCSDRMSVVHRRIEFAVQTRSSRMYRTYILERWHPWRFWMRTSVYTAQLRVCLANSKLKNIQDVHSLTMTSIAVEKWWVFPPRTNKRRKFAL